MASKKEIWKLQRPLFASNGGYGDVLAYTEDKTRHAMITLPMEQVEEIFGDEPKIYVVGEVKRGNLVVDDYAEEQAW